MPPQAKRCVICGGHGVEPEEVDYEKRPPFEPPPIYQGKRVAVEDEVEFAYIEENVHLSILDFVPSFLMGGTGFVLAFLLLLFLFGPSKNETRILSIQGGASQSFPQITCQQALEYSFHSGIWSVFDYEGQWTVEFLGIHKETEEEYRIHFLSSDHDETFQPHFLWVDGQPKVDETRSVVHGFFSLASTQEPLS